MSAIIVTDSSFDLEHRIAAWAAWAQSARGSFFGGNALEGRFENNNLAEMVAALNGLRIAIESKVVVEGDHFVLQTDSLYVANRLDIRWISSHKNGWQIAKAFQHPPPQTKIEFEKDASPTGDLQGYFINTVRQHRLTFNVVRSGGHLIRYVDALSRQYMRERRHDIAIMNGMKKGPPQRA